MFAGKNIVVFVPHWFWKVIVFGEMSSNFEYDELTLTPPEIQMKNIWICLIEWAFTLNPLASFINKHKNRR